MTRAAQPTDRVVVAGHICLDLIPTFAPGKTGVRLDPGTLVQVGPALRSTGGAVSNTGLALHRLGADVTLMGKVGDDPFGRDVLELLRQRDPALAEGMAVVTGEHTSYSIVVSPPGVDRMFLHCPGANDTFGPEDINPDRLAGAKLLHFGYPPIMKRMYREGGRELAQLLSEARQLGTATSLDTCDLDPDTEAGQTDWRSLLERVLPHVDVFAPSFDELCYMLQGPANEVGSPTPERLARLAETLLAMGAAVVVIKLGEHGLYLRTTDDRARLEQVPGDLLRDIDAWLGRELLSPCFEVEVVGANGSGDCTIAGLLAAILRGETPEQAATAATAVGACNVESADATTGVRPWPEVEARLKQGWARRKPASAFADWAAHAGDIRTGPHDRPRQQASA
ncbi:carbohydrate kinase family protein [Phycisphaerales bacterium AB-hyl4]|uniref:Carbohydrate kinase family protein n=1 Tax=Natronomicrosphaera hydrolytica TaxID=3242702 RepID=A0ABV4U1G5_9BACT